VLVPTRLELQALASAGGLPRGLAELELAGFGPLAAAARTAALCERHRPRRVLLLGIAGALRELAPGTALAFGRARLDGLAAAELGFAHWDEPRCGDELDLAAPRTGALPALLTVLKPAHGAGEAAARRARFPDAAAEDMEGFGAALAARVAGVPLAVVRGISNAAGERERARWRIAEALAAARALALELLEDSSW
jgi:futalosine hydrolase